MSKLKHIYLVRHGRSESNETGIIDGGESPLAEEGIKQAEIVAERFKNIPLEVVLSSNYKRAQETGRKIADTSNVELEIIGMAYENEISTAIHGLHDENPKVKEAVALRDKNWISGIEEKNQESYGFISNRVTELSSLLEKRNEEHIAVASHGFFLKLFVAHHILGDYLTAEVFLNGMNAHMRSTNTGITYFTINENNEWSLRSWNDSAHLGEMHV